MNDLFLRVCRGEAVERPPVWLMRQAGRYLPEYRAIRSGVSFLELCKSSELAAKVSLQPIDILGVDAAIVFADILIVPDAMGVELRFEKGDGPSFPTPIRNRDDIARLRHPDVEATLGYVFSTLRVLRAELDGRVPLIGFAGSPWTLAAYVVEGGVSTAFPRLLAWSYEDPSAVVTLLERLADTTIDYLRGQVEAGAQALQIFDTWGGLLSAERWRSLALPSMQRILESIPAGVPRILYLRNGGHLLEVLADLPVEVLSVDWRVPLDEVRRSCSSVPVLQGNLDPCTLLAPIEVIERETARVLEQGSGGGHIVNLGHGILPQTPVEHAKAFVRFAQGGGSRLVAKPADAALPNH